MSGGWVFGDMTVTPVHDYIDGDGDMLAIDDVDGMLAISVIARGKTHSLTCVLNDIDDVRKVARHLLDWAERSNQR